MRIMEMVAGIRWKMRIEIHVINILRVKGSWIMKIGENSVGKSLLFGTYDPLIPDELKREVQKQKSKRK